MGCCWLGRRLKICGGGFLGSAGCDYMGIWELCPIMKTISLHHVVLHTLPLYNFIDHPNHKNDHTAFPP